MNYRYLAQKRQPALDLEAADWSVTKLRRTIVIRYRTGPAWHWFLRLALSGSPGPPSRLTANPADCSRVWIHSTLIRRLSRGFVSPSYPCLCRPVPHSVWPTVRLVRLEDIIGSERAKKEPDLFATRHEWASLALFSLARFNSIQFN